MMKHLPVIFSMVLMAYSAYSQTRYLDDIYTRPEIQVANNVVFGQNYYFINYPPAPQGTSFGNPQIGPLEMDVYTPPASDNTPDRGLLIYLHTGSFLPKYLNQQTTGNKKDSTVVEICTRFAQKGYVVAAINYRLGWNPLAPTLVERTEGILNAVYRAIHDAQTAVRFFKSQAVTYQIDPNRIVLMGQGSGGYVALAYGYLDKVEETYLPKFLNSQGNSVIDTNTVGKIDGTGGTVNVYNHAGYSNKVAMVANLSGALGDISWMESGWPNVPVASLHCRKDVFAPFDSGTVIVPATGQPVVDVHGSRAVVEKAVATGLNDIWVNYTFTDPYSARAYAMNPKVTHEGLFQLERPDIPGQLEEGSPWEWWDSTAVTVECAAYGVNGTTVHTNSIASNPDMSKAKATAYIDTIVGFLSPRMYLVITDPSVGVEDAGEAGFEYNIFPNPSADIIKISVEGGIQISSASIFDMEGRMLITVQGYGNSFLQLEKPGLSPGMYIVKLQTNKGVATSKLLIE